MDNLDTPKRGFFATIFISSNERRLRAGWRLLLQLVFIGIASLLVNTPAFFIASIVNVNSNLIMQLSSGLAIILATWAARRWLDRRSFVSLGLTRDAHWLKDIVVGIGIAAVIMAFIFITELGAGWLTFSGFAWQTASMQDVLTELLIFAILFIAVGYYEELLSRGYHLQNLEEGLNLPWALFISSGIFGLAHLGNPNATWVSALGILAAGLFLAYGYLRTRQLWLAIGLHIGWNFFEGPVFGFPVSGLDTVRLLQHEVTGPEWITGGAFGPEAGLISIIAMLLGAALVFQYTQNRLTDTAQEPTE